MCGIAVKIIPLPAGQVDLWWVTIDDYTPARGAELLTLLNVDERCRYDAFKVSSAQTQFLAARALLRTTLSRYRALKPKDWYFTLNAYGRPYIANRQNAENLYFSVSHTDGMVACAVAHFDEFGIDIEGLDRQIDVPEMATNVLTPSEIKQLNDLPEDKRSETFILFWTLKEAYIKARSMGLTLPMTGVSFDLTGEKLRAQFSGAIIDDPKRWTFQHFRPTPRYGISISAAPPEGKFKLQLHPASVFIRA